MRGIFRSATNTSDYLLLRTGRYFTENRFRFLFILIAFCIITETETKSQNGLTGYDDLSVLVQVDGYGSYYTEALYSQKGVLYISVEDLFRFFKIPCTPGQNRESLKGFIENKNRTYTINFQSDEIIVGDKVTDVSNSLIRQNGMLFLESSVFGQVFGIKLPFNFRSLSIAVKSDFELPVVKEARVGKLRSNIRKNTAETVADTVLNRNYHMFRFGTLDWVAGATQITGKTADTRLGLGLGAELFKGEADVFINYSNKYKFDNRQQQYLWRWVDNSNRFVKQVQLGKIATQSISSVYYPVVGAVISNTPSSIRRAAGSYIINDVTQPDWLVELYINNVLMDFTKADASGLFTFKVPLVYGFTTLTLRFYGPMGEERSETRTMNVPYSFLPAGEFEYRLTGGMLENGKESLFGRAEANFGVARILTVGAGMEYLSLLTGQDAIPFVTASFLPLSKLMIKGEYDYGVRIKGLLNYYLWSNSLLELDYTKYEPGQHAILYNYLEERKANFSVPWKIKSVSGFARLGYKQSLYSDFNYNMAEVLLSGYYRQFNANISTYANWLNDWGVNMNMGMALSYRIKNGLTIRPSAQANISKREILAYKVEVEQRFRPNGYLAVYFENNAMLDYNSVNLSFKYDLSFAQTNLSARYNTKKELVTYQGARGSLAFGSGNKHVKASPQSSVGRGGITVIPFVDINHNGIFDKGEPRVGNLVVKINGGQVSYSKKDSIILITGLEPFVSYNLELSDKNFENIAWRLKYKNYKVLVDPNQFKSIEVPVVPAGEISGMVYLKTEGTAKGLGRILINIYNVSGVKIAETLSESDGYMNYLGLEPGKYKISIDTVQLRRLGMISEPLSLPFTLKAGVDGDVVDGLDFSLTMRSMAGSVTADKPVQKQVPEAETVYVIPQKPVPAKDTTYVVTLLKSKIVVHESTEEMSAAVGSYTLQLGAFKNETSAMNLSRQLKNLTGKDVKVVMKDDLYKVGITGIKDRNEVNEILNLLQQTEISVVWLIRMEPRKQKTVLSEQQIKISKTKETAGVSTASARSFAIQTGAFRQEVNAQAYRNKVAGMVDKQVVTVSENGFFKVRIIGFESSQEAQSYASKIKGLGLSQIQVVPVKIQEELIPEIQQPVIEPKPGEAKPAFALQAGVFTSRSQAVAAQKKINSALGLPVEIVEQWDYYRVIITGFATREETYKYYPELAGLGYSKISVIETK